MPKLWLWLAVLEVALVGAILASPAVASGPFKDNFSGRSPKGRNWVVNPNGGDVAVAGGMLNMSAFRSSTFPYVYSDGDPFASFDNFSVKMGFAYPSVTNYGTGIVLDSGTPSNGALAPSSTPVASIWQDWINGLRVSFGGQVVHQAGITKAYHTFKVDYVAGVYRLYLDDSLIYTSGQTAMKPSSIWIGNYQPIDHLDDWTDLMLDYIEVVKPAH